MTFSNEHSWHVRTWARTHATHGSFFVGLNPDGTAGASRVYTTGEPQHAVEDLAPLDRFANVALAMMACEQRIAELDQALVDQTCADLRAYAGRVA